VTLTAVSASATELTVTPTSGDAPLTVTLTPTLSSDVQSYIYVFGDSTPQTTTIDRSSPDFGKPVSHTYTMQGNYVALLVPDTGRAPPVIISVNVPPPNTDVQVPEFPSIAVPVAAILGLIVIFGRRKT
jgi:PKD repeat protein